MKQETLIDLARLGRWDHYTDRVGQARGYLLATAVLAVGCRSTAPRAVAVAEDRYVDSRVCAGCHREIAESYARTGMGRSASRVSASNRIEEFQSRNKLVHRSSDRVYTMTFEPEAVHVKRHQTGPDGRETNVMEKRAEWIIGSGNHARSYLARNGEGKFVEMPVSWYSEKGGYWAMSPGFDQPDHEDFRRVMPDGCLFCHTAYPRKAGELEAIDCQRCHGPGAEHAEAAGKGQKGAIVNPAKLDRGRQLELCMQCHLETTSSPLPGVIRRAGREVYSFRPAEAIEKYALFFDHAPGTGHDDKFEIAHAAYRLRKSVCFQKSGMTCGSCHNPHQAKRGAEAEAHYTAACVQCHQQAHNRNASCTGCHMPKRRAEDAVHVVMTDHFIQRRAPAGNLLAERPEARPKPPSGEVALYYPASLPASPESEAYLALAQVQHGANLPAGLPRLVAAVRAWKPEGPEFYFELGKAHSKAGKETQAVEWYEEAVRRRSDFVLALKGLSASLITLGQFDRAAALLAGAANPDANMLTNQGHALLRRGDADGAVKLLERALAANPDVSEAANLLGLAWLRKGEAVKGEAQFREAIRLQPDMAAAHGNLANVLAGRQELVGARRHFEKSLELNGADAEVRRNFAFLLVLLKSFDQARRQLEEAVRLDPSQPQARMELAEMLEAGGRLKEAAEQYRAALRLRPDLAEAQAALENLEGRLKLPAR